ncbi:hypothetical protein TNCT_470521 [Trichonephila clavata]|uniref:Uncharacterized protein n=1 Tax=Trichonephila clavata TaxID=2740835 RepID=A0A8X6JJX1_TRICU|nr:hypothetical protein TNCT_470521 [Trichonephila clavata]
MALFSFFNKVTVSIGIYCCSTCHEFDKQDSLSIPKDGDHQIPRCQSLTGFPQPGWRSGMTQVSSPSATQVLSPVTILFKKSSPSE